MGHCKLWSGSNLSVQLTRPTGRDGSGIKTLFGAAGTALRHSPLSGLLRLNIFADVGPCKKQRGRSLCQHESMEPADASSMQHRPPTLIFLLTCRLSIQPKRRPPSVFQCAPHSHPLS